MAAVDVELYSFRGYVFEPDGIAFGDGKTRDVSINGSGGLSEFQLAQPTITFTIKGAIAADVSAFDEERGSNITKLLARQPIGETISIAGKVYETMWLRKVTPSAPTKIGGVELIDTLALEFGCQKYY